ncbi:UvrD-helicase domain-containing protein [Neobittarella massiliensis]|uniref:UvrD-helicase domain-containing protein n=1 Tax=Neobittarella massiliensis (ex Bilen et al. 2018) TaxID=2041842 RepID=UPI000CF6DCFA|nr:UvrD-helicase domain-containing protein [Neobittarella massiliensis]
MAAKRRFTPAQQAAVDDRGGTLLISAAAGSGKTSVLTARVVALLCDEQCPRDPQSMLIVTFTHAAAAEMKQRIYQGLADKIAKDPQNAFLRRQQALVGRADICTIHAFCLRLIREQFSSLGLRRDFSLCDDAQARLLKKETVARLLDEKYERAEPGFLALSEQIDAQRSDHKLGEVVLGLHDFFVSHPYPEHWCRQMLAAFAASGEDFSASPWGIQLCQSAAALCEDLLQTVDRMRRQSAEDGVLYAALDDLFSQDAAQVRTVCQAARSGDVEALRQSLLQLGFARFAAPKGYADDPLKKQLQQDRDKLKKALKDFLQKRLPRSLEQHAQDVEAQLPVLRQMYDLVLEFDAQLTAEKRAQNLLEFSDLEQMALRLCTVRDGDTIRQSDWGEKLAADIDFIMVDEYQDTNDAQDALFLALSKNGGNLFMVGDVKQSIYRFRQARPEIFMQKKRAFSPYDGVHYPALINLDRNFRSSRDVTETVNFFFSRLMSLQVGEVDYRDGEALVCAGGYDKFDLDTATEVALIDCSDPAAPKPVAGQAQQSLFGAPPKEDPPPCEETRTPDEQEADWVAARIAQMVQDGFLVRDGDEVRPARYGDFAVLLRSVKGKAGTYIRRMKLAGVPAAGEGSQGFLTQKEVVMVKNLLGVLKNPKNDLALTGCMLSPIFGFTPGELAAIRAGAPPAPEGARQSFYSMVLCCRGQKKVDDFLSLTEHFRRLSDLLSARELIERIYDATDLPAIVGQLSQGRVRQENLKLLLTYAQQFGQSGSARDFLAYLERIEEQKGDLKGAQGPGGEDAVSVLSIHRSKGLEFPVCFVCDLGHLYNLSDIQGRWLLSPALGFSLYRRREHFLQHSTLCHEAARLQQKASTISEEMRILYVAMTRAKQKLILTMHSTDPQNWLLRRHRAGTSPYAVSESRCFGDCVLSALADCSGADSLFAGLGVVSQWQKRCGFGLVANSCRAPQPPQPASAPHQAQPAAPDAALVAQLKQQLAYRYPLAALGQVPAKVSVSQLAKGRSTRLNTRPVFTYQGGLTPVQRGNALHKFMQYCSYHRAAADPAAEIARLRAEAYLHPQEADSIEPASVAAFFASDIGAEILACQTLYRELDFFTAVDSGEIDPASAGLGAQVLIQGVADCVLDRGDGLWIIDYKTDRVKAADQLAERYRTQLEVYPRGIGELLGKPVTRRVLYSFYLGQSVDV